MKTKGKLVYVFIIFQVSFYLLGEENLKMYDLGMPLLLNEDNWPQQVMVSPGQMLPFITIFIGEHLFDVAVKNGIIEVIFLSHKGMEISKKPFKTPEGVYIGMTYADLKNLLPESRVIPFYGWLYEVSLPSGWKVGFSPEAKYTHGVLKSDEKVISIYKN